ncbi:hypothetical protein DL766_006705 [Monosporascus sp. MC13-8B]|uniref:F-box domain-containing protein n=1 Tax=Monosporascus cannonballus TaxID=155416 RepID=A0ABY0H1U7_9PEZI|nr:hypothetical protein DL762_008038 [Monosporascus cannonballus]RYO84474.1 hypothetical protein DL763_007459 [Monosporascus cannonballus]RYP26520.1 hypothetical protein DL766_006705 [Monosporascus sp. MC13-8B]
MKLSRFFRRSKKSSSEGGSNGKHHAKTSSYGGYTHDDFERDKYRLYNGRHEKYYNPALERGNVFAPWYKLPDDLLERVFSFVCPHCCDESYETCEHSAIEDACMLCDLRDIAHAGQVSKQWRKVAIKLMYHSIRIDSVHYCEREIDLSERRKRRTRFDRNGVPEDPAAQRLRLLCRTLREDPTRLGVLVQYFKTPYMLRESKTPDLARTIAVLPNLHYVDLPEGLFCDDPSYHTLKLEVQARCPDLRKMTYNGGSELSLEALNRGNVWLNLEVLELGRINMDPAKLRYVLAVLQRLRALKVSETRVMDDEIFFHNDMLPAFPALEELVLKDVPKVTSAGLVAYLSRTDAQNSLKVLSLDRTGVLPSSLHEVLSSANSIKTLAITEQVDSAFPAATTPIPPLVNWSLETLRYEITASPSTSPYASITAGYYNYLASSLFAGGLPRLAAIYVRDQNFPEMLLGLPPPLPGFAGASGARPSSSSSERMFSTNGPLLSPGFNQQPQRFSSNNPFATAALQSALPNPNSAAPFAPRGPANLALNQTLEVFTKGEDDLDWGSIRMDPFDLLPPGGGGGGGGRGRGHARTGSTAGRPMSGYGLESGWQMGHGARMSVVMGNGAGGFLAVPGGEMAASGRRGSAASVGAPPRGAGGDDWPRPGSSAGHKKAERDLWR